MIRNNIRRAKDLYQFLKLFRKREQLVAVTNGNTLARVQQDNAYKELEQEFSEMIQNGAEPEGEAQRSDKIWICWLQGEEQAPELVKSCIRSMRENLPNKEIVVLDEKTIPQYIQFPDHIIKKYQEGKINRTHFSDILRTALLCKYGGIWADATVLCTSSDIPKAITESPLFVFQAMDLTRWERDSIVASSWFISCMSNQPILLLTRDLLYEYWKNHDTLIDYFVFHLLFAMATRRYPEDWKKVPVYNNHSPHVLQFELGEPYDEERWDEIKKMSVFHKLNHHNDYSQTGESFYNHIIKDDVR